MKLTVLTFLMASGLGFSQVLQSEDFDQLTVGNISTNVDASSSGQADFYNLLI